MVVGSSGLLRLYHDAAGLEVTVQDLVVTFYPSPLEADIGPGDQDAIGDVDGLVALPPLDAGTLPAQDAHPAEPEVRHRGKSSVDPLARYPPSIVGVFHSDHETNRDTDNNKCYNVTNVIIVIK
jgi:hypothetical protein